MPAPTIVQHVSAFANSATSLTATFASAVTAGHMILAFGGAGQNVTFGTPTMTGETFTAWAGASNAGTAGNGQTSVFAVNSAAGGQTGVTITISPAADLHLHIIEISGQAASPRDAQGNTESTTLSVSTSGATTVATDLVIGFFHDNATNTTYTVGAGYTQVELTANGPGGDAALSESKAVTATGVQTATATSSAADTINQSIVAIAGTTVVVSTPWGWYAQWVPPVRRPVYNEGYIAWAAQTPPNLPVTPAQYGWYSAWDYTPRPAPRFTEGKEVWVPTAFPFQNPPIGWFTPFSTPVLKRGYNEGWFAWTPTSASIQPPPYGWFSLWGDPPRSAVRAAEGWLAWNPQAIVSAQVSAPPFGWYASWSLPTPLQVPVQGWIAFDPQTPPNLPVTPSTYGWYEPWQSPTRLVRNVEGQFAWAPQVIVAPARATFGFVNWIQIERS